MKSVYTRWLEGEQEPAGTSLEHAYAGSRHVQNVSGASYGAVWQWAGAQHAHAAPLKSPNPDTAAQAAYNIANDKTPQRSTWWTPTTAGDALCSLVKLLCGKVYICIAHVIYYVNENWAVDERVDQII